MIRLKHFLYAAALALFALAAGAQTANYYPVPSNIWSAKGALAVAQDENNLTGIAAVASGQVLTSAGTGTIPAWSASPTLTAVNAATVAATTSATIGSGTAITKIAVYTVTLSGANVGANTCTEINYALAGIATTDKLFVNASASSPALVNIRPSTGANAFLMTFCNPGGNLASSATGSATIVAIRSS
jgi:hypothetical protein